MQVFKTVLGVVVAAMLVLSGCGVTQKVTDPAATAGVERCGSPTRACWQVKPTTDAVEYPPETTAATAPGTRHDSTEQTRDAQ